MSLFDSMAKDQRLKNHFKKATESTPDQRIDNNSFSGADGEYHFTFIKFNDFQTKEKVDCCEFQFRVIHCEGQEEQAGELANIFLMFRDDEYNTKEEVQDRFMQTCQLVGVETAGKNPKQIEKGIASVIGSSVLGAIVTGKSAKKNKSLYLRGPSSVEASTDAPDPLDSVPDDVKALGEPSIVFGYFTFKEVGEACDAGDADAQELLTEYCPEGINPDDLSWMELAAEVEKAFDINDGRLVKKGEEDEWEGETAEKHDLSSIVGFVCYYTPVGEEQTQFWVAGADTDSQTVSLCDEEDVILYEDVKYSNLDSVDDCPF